MLAQPGSLVFDRILNHSESSALRIAIIQGVVHIVATIGSIILVDRIGRKCASCPVSEGQLPAESTVSRVMTLRRCHAPRAIFLKGKLRCLAALSCLLARASPRPGPRWDSHAAARRVQAAVPTRGPADAGLLHISGGPAGDRVPQASLRLHPTTHSNVVGLNSPVLSARHVTGHAVFSHDCPHTIDPDMQVRRQGELRHSGGGHRSHLLLHSRVRLVRCHTHRLCHHRTRA